MASLHKNRRTTLERIEKFTSKLYFSDVNLFSKIYPQQQCVDIYHWALPDGKHWKDVSFTQVKQQQFNPAATGQSFGPTWTTHWFKVVVKIPDEWVGKEVHFRWNSNSEALLFNRHGEPLQGLTGSPDFQKREEYIISKAWKKDQISDDDLVYYIEMACNGMFGAGKGGMIDPPDPDRSYSLQLANVSVCDTVSYQLLIDLELLYEMAKELTEENGKGDQRGYQALYTGNQMINAIQAGDIQQAQTLSNDFFKLRNGDRAHTIEAMGHCHIDTAWLWSYDETIRKCSRSWSSVIALMKEYPDMTFVCSQAQQFSWIKEFYPSLYKEIKHYVTLGRFIPVGGTWVEMDGNIPSGESFVRQFLLGQRFFLKEFGVRCKEFWLPDTFGYSAQTPQIMKHVGISRFLTTKLSWSLVNKFPHHNFWWQGLDSSTVLVHFPPGESYETSCKISDALKTERNLLDKGRVSRSTMLYGFGDGGGGPHRPMLDRLNRLQDVDGIPKIEHSTPDKFFQHLESEGSKLCRWVGELYLELHNGTYTSQADMKKFNRSCELKLRDAELLLSVALIHNRIPVAEIEALRTKLYEAWRLLLVNQFHDVLPGSSIELVHTEAKQWFHQSLQLAQEVLNQCGDHLGAHSTTTEPNALLNTLPWPREALMHESGRPTRAVRIQPMSWNCTDIEALHPVTLDVSEGNFKISNRFFSLKIDRCGRILSMVHTSSGNETIPTGHYGNQIVMFDDIPLYWDAWDCMDYHLETRQVVNHLESIQEAVHVELDTPLKVTLKWSQKVGNQSYLEQRIHVSAVNPFVEFENNIKWAENRKFLKVEFSTDVHANYASYETQFGHLSRPNHKNTSWDSAKFEVCGHKWADLSEPEWGAAILNDSKYGWNIQGRVMTLSLLRSPKAPDAHCDMHDHTFRYAFMPHNGLKSRADVIRESYNFNCLPIPIQLSSDAIVSNPWFWVDSPNVVLETVKPCEPPISTDGETPNDERKIVIRFYESTGSRTIAKFHTNLPLIGYQECNGLEEALEPLKQLTPTTAGSGLSFSTALTPFQIKSYSFSY